MDNDIKTKNYTRLKNGYKRNIQVFGLARLTPACLIVLRLKAMVHSCQLIKLEVLWKTPGLCEFQSGIIHRSRFRTSCSRVGSRSINRD